MPTDPLAALPERSVSMHRAFRGYLDRAFWVGLVVAVVIGGLTGFRLGTAGEVYPAAILAAVLGGVVGSIAGWLTVPPRIRAAWRAFSWLGRTELDRFIAATGGPMPQPADIDAWLAAHPPTSAFATARVEAPDLRRAARRGAPRARRAPARPHPGDDAIALERLSQRQYLAWVTDGPGARPGDRCAALVPGGAPGGHARGIRGSGHGRPRRRADGVRPARSRLAGAAGGGRARTAQGRSDRPCATTIRPQLIFQLLGALVASLVARSLGGAP
jgi:hypothetical protein